MFTKDTLLTLGRFLQYPDFIHLLMCNRSLYDYKKIIPQIYGYIERTNFKPVLAALRQNSNNLREFINYQYAEPCEYNNVSILAYQSVIYDIRVYLARHLNITNRTRWGDDLICVRNIILQFENEYSVVNVGYKGRDLIVKMHELNIVPKTKNLKHIIQSGILALSFFILGYMLYRKK
jgi:hypothetical protein